MVRGVARMPKRSSVPVCGPSYLGLGRVVSPVDTCEGRKPSAETTPDAVALAKQL